MIYALSISKIVISHFVLSDKDYLITLWLSQPVNRTIMNIFHLMCFPDDCVSSHCVSSIVITVYNMIENEIIHFHFTSSDVDLGSYVHLELSFPESLHSVLFYHLQNKRGRSLSFVKQTI